MVRANRPRMRCSELRRRLDRVIRVGKQYTLRMIPLPLWLNGADQHCHQNSPFLSATVRGALTPQRASGIVSSAVAQCQAPRAVPHGMMASLVPSSGMAANTAVAETSPRPQHRISRGILRKCILVSHLRLMAGKMSRKCLRHKDLCQKPRKASSNPSIGVDWRGIDLAWRGQSGYSVAL